MQNGRHAVKYSIGAVDGKTSWSNYSILGARLNQDDKSSPVGNLVVTGKPVPDAMAGAGLEIVSLIGKSIADKSMQDDPAYYDRLLARMVGEREIGAAVGQVVLPAVARAWGLPFNPAQLIVLPVAGKIEDADGRYTATDPGTDLVLAFTLSELMLSEKPSMRGLKAVVSMGMYDKEVMPYLVGEVAAYRRQPAGHLQRVWAGRCGNGFVDAPADEWTALRADPLRGGALIDKTVPRVAAGCEEALKRQFAAL